MKACLAPLAGHADVNGQPVKDRISIVSNMSIPVGGDNGIAAGRIGGDSFHFHVNPMITGNRQINGLFSSEVTGISADQIVAQQHAGETTFDSLSYRAQASFYIPGGGIENVIQRTTLSFDQAGNPITARVSPRQAYDSLFTGFAPPDPADAARKRFELSKRKSMLDLVDRNIAGLLPRMGAYDRERLDRHYTEVRALEKLLNATPSDQVGACELLPDPGPDSAVGGNFGNPGGWNTNDGYSDEDSRAAIFNRLVHMAFVCDLTRSATLMYTMFQSFMNAQPLVGAPYNCHELNHRGNQTQLNDFGAWHADHFGELVALLRDTPEGDGSVLDQCALVFLVEGGLGPGSHTTDNMVALVAGGAGGLRQGEHVVAPNGTHPAQVLISAMNTVGVPQNALGEVQGQIGGLFG